jgi:hypothetical protein
VKPLFGLASVVKYYTLVYQVLVVKDSTLAIRREDHSDLPLVVIVEELDSSFAAAWGLWKTYFFLCRLNHISEGQLNE